MPEEEKPQALTSGAAGTPTAQAGSATTAPTPAAVVPAVPPIPPQQAAQSLQMLIQAGIMPSPPMQPEVVKCITDYLSHESNNRLDGSKTEGGRRLKLRMTALIIGALLFFTLLLMPVLALIRGDTAFVNSFLEHHMPYLVAIVLAIVGGAGLKDLFKA